MSTVALVTGAAGGIGAAVVERLRRDGRTVIGLDRDPGTDVVVDVTDRAAVEGVVAEIEKTGAGIDVLVNAAGILRTGSAFEADPDDLAEMLAVNVLGVATVSRAVGTRMARRRHGSIVTVSSNAAATARADMVGYGASKAAVAQYTIGLGLELAADGVRCNVVAPGSTRTAMLVAAGVRSDGDDRAAQAVAAAIAGDAGRFRNGIPLGRVAEPEDIAAAVAFLISDDARHITMQTLTVDGGATAC
ncbi:SDR family oxidoreductase [Microbacterium oxydans]|uniref:2,3-dihydro-2,3-dihydroxybenzoate dehydrogenase n=1 Tax=Microbacterium maritypicum TaxID=33918 RepID=A0A4Y4B183_MICMQ|nr:MULTISPECIES: SDR family oxidoreductase [Microbacterium]MBE7952720.1 SDR family oxidoreductase [Microbacterium sp. R1]MCB8045410.1 SDR family oxidoreductase [Microbacterium oxydans]GEC74116.1 2,3-dihydro-2,3-dihydroxybenzoate dehydrogenase [Microbacterium liquefaciens]GGV49171.1 2,3-dihydro-2,3-dihydroxybenzoate dehydrogenase [Microbacterium liquefaciens]